MEEEKDIIILFTQSIGKTIVCDPMILPSHKQLVSRIESFTKLLNATKDHLYTTQNLCALKNKLKKEEVQISGLIDKVINDCIEQDKQFWSAFTLDKSSKLSTSRVLENE